MADKDDPKFALYELFVATAEKTTDRRAQANAWMLSVNSAIVALYGYLQTGKTVATSGAFPEVWLWAIPVAGTLVCAAWYNLLKSFRLLGTAKFAVIKQLETELAFDLFTREEKVYQEDGRYAASKVESIIPLTFAALYVAMVVAAVVL